MNPGKFEEHPIPLIVITSWGCLSNSDKAFCIAVSTPKSPQPGHQSGSILPLYESRVTSTLDSGIVSREMALFTMDLLSTEVAVIVILYTLSYTCFYTIISCVGTYRLVSPPKINLTPSTI